MIIQIVRKRQRHSAASGGKGRQNSYRKSSDPAGQNPGDVDIQQPGKAGDFGNGAPETDKARTAYRRSRPV